MSFEWQTQEEIRWDEPIPLGEPPSEPTPARRGRWLYVVLIGLVGLATAVLLILRVLNQRVDDAETEARLSVISSHHVIQQATAAKDAELFVGFLSGRQPEWSSALEEAVAAGTYMEWQGLGLQRVGGDDLVGDTAVVTFSPDLTAAELIVTHTYAAEIGHGLTETLLLEQTAVYRLGPNRWLLAPPEPDFWGQMQTSNGRYLITTYPERDAEIGRRLAADLDRKLIEMCEYIIELDCPSNLQIRLELSTEPHTLLPLHGGYIPNGYTLQVPTPSLIGKPQDELGYRALQRGYGRWLVSAVISQLAEWSCCDRYLFHEAILNMQWQQLGLKSPTPIAYEQVQTNTQQLGDLLQLWGIQDQFAKPEEKQAVYALIEFLTVEIGLSSLNLQYQLSQSSYLDWLLVITNEQPLTYADLDREWQRFLTERVSRADALHTWPEQDLQLLCLPNGQTKPLLMRYRIQTALFTTEQHLLSDQFSLLPLPNGRGIFLSGPALAEPQIWAEGRAAILPSLADLPALAADPQGDYLLLVDLLHPVSPYRLLPLSQCLAGGNCNQQSLSGYPVWSPNGSQMAMVGFDLSAQEPLVSLANGSGEGERLIGAGDLPFWLDENRLGLVRGGRELWVEKTAGGDLEIVVSLDELLAQLPATRMTDSTLIDFVTADPHNPNRLLIATADAVGRPGSAHLFVYDRERERVLMPFAFGDEPADYTRRYELSPNGRWLTITRFDSSQTKWLLYLYDILQNETFRILVDEPFAPSAPRLYDWSADSHWLVVSQQGILRLIQPASNYERLVIAERAYCTTAVWVY